MNKLPEISILLPVYNAGRYLREAIDSILSQTFTDYELIIINDGSTDNSRSIISSYSDARIIVLDQPNGGVSRALNNGLKVAKANLIARFDADDICYPERLEEQYSFLKQNPDYILVGSDAEYVSEDGHFIFRYESPAYTDHEIRKIIKDVNPFIHSVVTFYKEHVLECGGYDEKAHTFEDHLLWVKVIAKGKVCNMNKAFVKVRLNPSSVTTDERLRGKRFLNLRKEILQKEQITDAEERELTQIIKSQSSKPIKVLGYHLFVAKKFLWNNYRPADARRHLFLAIKEKPMYLDLYILLVISLLPRKLIGILYIKLKKGR